jgi:cytochrome c peroxidase
MKLGIICSAILLMILTVVILDACQPTGNKKNSLTEASPNDLGTIDALPVDFRSPANNSTTEEKIELGRLLFYDPILSGGKDVACATCHHPEFGYAESLELSIGVNGKGLGEKRVFNNHNDIPFVKRNAQSLLNIAFNGINADGDYDPDKAPMFWDLRAAGLEEQAMFPVKALEEMRGHQFIEEKMPGEIVKRINAIAQYKKLFKKSFPENDSVTVTNVSKALAAFQRSLLANNSRFDKYKRGDASALSSREIEGMQLFIKTGCARCHNGPMFSDFKTHVLGVADNDKLAVSDSGYQQTYAFRTPTLRNLRVTRPYMHSGKLQTLENVLEFYEDLPGKDLPNKHIAKQSVDSLAMKLKVEFRNIPAIVEFLNTLNDFNFDKKIPATVPSGLQVGGSIK